MGYRPLPTSVPVPEPVLARLAVSKADWAHGVETVAHMAQDTGRTEGAMAVVGVELTIVLFAVACGVAGRLTGAAVNWIARR